jgi:hypothetical protein
MTTIQNSQTKNNIVKAIDGLATAGRLVRNTSYTSDNIRTMVNGIGPTIGKTSINPSDYCYNSHNKGQAKFDMGPGFNDSCFFVRCFQTGEYIYIGPNAPYTGLVLHAPHGSAANTYIYGTYDNGVFVKSVRKIVALQGIGNSGKTVTLKKLIIEVQKLPGTCAGKHNNLATALSQVTPVVAGQTQTDTWAIFDIPDKEGVEAKRVGITTAGDNVDSLFREIDKFTNEKCDIVFVACRISGQTVDFLEFLRAYHVAAELVYVQHDSKQLNNQYQAAQVQTLLALI